MRRVNNSPERKQERRRDAGFRQSERDNRSSAEQLGLIMHRRGESTKERRRLLPMKGNK